MAPFGKAFFYNSKAIIPHLCGIIQENTVDFIAQNGFFVDLSPLFVTLRLAFGGILPVSGRALRRPPSRLTPALARLRLVILSKLRPIYFSIMSIDNKHTFGV